MQQTEYKSNYDKLSVIKPDIKEICKEFNAVLTKCVWIQGDSNKIFVFFPGEVKLILNFIWKEQKS